MFLSALYLKLTVGTNVDNPEDSEIPPVNKVTLPPVPAEIDGEPSIVMSPPQSKISLSRLSSPL